MNFQRRKTFLTEIVDARTQLPQRVDQIAALTWVKDNIADRIALRELHTGDLELDEDA